MPSGQVGGFAGKSVGTPAGKLEAANGTRPSREGISPGTTGEMTPRLL